MEGKLGLRISFNKELFMEDFEKFKENHGIDLPNLALFDEFTKLAKSEFKKYIIVGKVVDM